MSKFFEGIFSIFNKSNKSSGVGNNEISGMSQTNELLYQTIEAMVSAIDAKDTYTRGHSTRVANYSKKIAQLSGMSDDECEDVYLAALLHDTGKIGISDSIINKKGRLTELEYEIIKEHPVLGAEILSKITLAPVLEIGARYHHERYDGKGYPEGLKGKDIPRIARIIAVADAYDAMTSKRSYRDQIPQQKVREELLTCSGTQFDPKYAAIMIHMIDKDSEYRMRENIENDVFGNQNFYNFEDFKSAVTPGIRITNHPAVISIRYRSLESNDSCVPTILLYDSLSESYVIDDDIRNVMDFDEYGTICLDGKVTVGNVRNMQQNNNMIDCSNNFGIQHQATIWLVKQEDHLMVKITTDLGTNEVIYALTDKSRFVYMALTGRECMMDILDVTVNENELESDSIPRIAEEITYIEGVAGDIPNVQIDGWRNASSEPVKVNSVLEMSFESKSLPTATRMWHCPIICLFTSDNGEIHGPNYQELALIRFDGEAWSELADVENNYSITKDATFGDWNSWKQKNKQGVYCTVYVQHMGEKIVTKAENAGLHIENITSIPFQVSNLSIFITGDQCAITDIRIS